MKIRPKKDHRISIFTQFWEYFAETDKITEKKPENYAEKQQPYWFQERCVSNGE